MGDTSPYRAEHDGSIVFQALHGGGPDSEHVIARCDDVFWAQHIADALTLKWRFGRGEVAYV